MSYWKVMVSLRFAVNKYGRCLPFGPGADNDGGVPGDDIINGLAFPLSDTNWPDNAEANHDQWSSYDYVTF